MALVWSPTTLKLVALMKVGVRFGSKYCKSLKAARICAIISRAQSLTVLGACPSGQPSGGVALFDPGVVDQEPSLDMSIFLYQSFSILYLYPLEVANAR